MLILNKNKIKLVFSFKAYHPYILEKVFSRLNSILVEKKQLFTVANIPQRVKKFTVLKSPHIDKKSREQFEMRVYKKTLSVFFDNFDLNKNSEINTFKNLVQQNSNGLGLKIKYILKKSC